MEVGVLESIGDDSHPKGGFLNVKGGQADAVDGNGAFFNDQGRELFGEFKIYFKAADFIPDLFAGSGGVHVPLYKMAVHPGGREQASLQVDLTSYRPLMQVGFF